jgi:hypothetical protein
VSESKQSVKHHDIFEVVYDYWAELIVARVWMEVGSRVTSAEVSKPAILVRGK